jgi:hypothetical protein
MIVRKWKHTFLLAFVFSIFFSTRTRAQVQNGSVTGLVTDPSSALIPRAHVEAADEASGIHLSAMTTSAGEYVFPSLSLGAYALSVTAHGFERTLRTHVWVEVVQRQAVDFRLTDGATTQTVHAGSDSKKTRSATVWPGRRRKQYGAWSRW